MLVLTRRLGERIFINENIIVKIIAINGFQVVVGIDAPDTIPVHREEVQIRINEEYILNSRI